MLTDVESSVTPVPRAPSRPGLWYDSAPDHFDVRVPWWAKLLVVAVAVIVSILFLDQRIAEFARDHAASIPDLGRLNAKTYSDATTKPVRGNTVVGREMMFLEQWGQGVCSIAVVLAVGILDRQGRRRALAIGIGCIITLLITHLLKDLFGRSRPFVFADDGSWFWGGPAKGFKLGAAWGSFPSAHTTAAFALASGLSWFYPRGRALFMTLALITATQRVFHAAHYLSDTLAGMAIGVMVMRSTLTTKLAGVWIALSPRLIREWWMRENR